MMTESEAHMAKQFNPPVPIEDLLDQINNGQDLAIAVETGVHNDACKEWNRLPVNLKTYANLQRHLTRAHRELHQLQSAARHAGYIAKNIKNKEDDSEICHRTVAALENLVDAIDNDQTSM
eukprot:10991370-Ditylum_brightwellii.AAC.1